MACGTLTPVDWFSSYVVPNVAKKSLSGIIPTGLQSTNIDSYVEKYLLAWISEFWARGFFTTWVKNISVLIYTI
jgi:hypothetical protein